MRVSFMNIISILVLGMLLSACGTKGPLYIPEKQYPQDSTESAPQPAPAPASSY